MGTLFVIVILLVIGALAVKSVIHRIRHGSACCGERDAPQKKIQPADKNKSHYPYKYTLAVDGMHCSNCTRHVENALNSFEGLWATASLENKTVTVLSKTELESADLETEVREAGYTVLAVTSN
jgi:copper chaperone CopZ